MKLRSGNRKVNLCIVVRLSKDIYPDSSDESEKKYDHDNVEK
jgi:hypothetical protein